MPNFGNMTTHVTFWLTSNFGIGAVSMQSLPVGQRPTAYRLSDQRLKSSFSLS
jgi:hypothetical protein